MALCTVWLDTAWVRKQGEMMGYFKEGSENQLESFGSEMTSSSSKSILQTVDKVFIKLSTIVLLPCLNPSATFQSF